MNTIDWLRETAKFMSTDRPDVYPSGAEAVVELTEALEQLRVGAPPNSICSIMFTSYMLTRVEHEGMEEFILSRKLSGLGIFPEEEIVAAISYDPRVNLPDVLDEPGAN